MQPVHATTAPALTQHERQLAVAIAEHMATLLHDDKPPARMVDAATLAAELGVSRDFVYAHASELGGKRLGGGPRGRLRFDLAQALARWPPAPHAHSHQNPPRPSAPGSVNNQAAMQSSCP
jgi:hypothetical protein